MNDRVEMTKVHSALVARATARSLVRALQTMDDNWSYQIPFEDDSFWEIEQSPFRLLGWLRSEHFDDSSGIDSRDPFRSHGLGICAQPGRMVIDACGLKGQDDRLVWVGKELEAPMFVYQTWGLKDDPWEREGFDFAVCGHRLLAKVEQLRSFLEGSEWDLVVEVEVTRHDRKERRFAVDGEDGGRHRVARVYRIGGDGHYEDAEGSLGTWSSDC